MYSVLDILKCNKVLVTGSLDFCNRFKKGNAFLKIIKN